MCACVLVCACDFSFFLSISIPSTPLLSICETCVWVLCECSFFHTQVPAAHMHRQTDITNTQETKADTHRINTHIFFFLDCVYMCVNATAVLLECLLLVYSPSFDQCKYIFVVVGSAATKLRLASCLCMYKTSVTCLLSVLSSSISSPLSPLPIKNA